MAKQELTFKNFDAQLNATVRSIKTQTEKSLQTYLEFGFKWYLKEGDSGLLSKCVQACTGVPALKTRTMEKYIVASTDLKCVSVEISAGKDKGKMQRVFKRVQSGSAVERVYTDLGINWTQFEAPEAEPVVWDEHAYLQRVIKMYTSKLPTLKGKAQQDALKHLVAIKALAGDDSLTSIAKAA